jgi:hypothetical protein
MVPDGWAAGGNEDDAGTCRWAQRKMRQRNIATIVLLGFGENNQVTYQWISKVRRKYPNIRYLHINSHGHHECDGAGIFGFDTPRTIVQFNDGIWPSYNSRRWTDLGQQVPEDYDYLSDNLEKANTFAHLGFHNDQIRLLVIESCYGLRNVATMNAEHLIEYIDDAYEYEHDHYLNAHPSYPFSDVVLVFNMFSENQVAIGGASPIIKGIYPAYSRFFNYLYTYMADGMNFRDAYNYLVGTTSSQTVLREHRVRGLGLSALSNITLNSNP